MGMVKTDEQNYINIANAIRQRTGSADTFTPGEMDEAILAIPAGGAGLSNDVKQALLQIAEKVAYIDDQGQTYYQALYDALYVVASISAVFTQGGATIYDTDSLDTLKQYLVVTAIYEDESSATVTDYTLSGTLTEGTSTITVSYKGKTDTFSVTVTAAPLIPVQYQQVEYIKATGTQHIITDISVADSATGNNSVALYTYDIDFKFDEWQSAYGTNIMAGFGSNAGKWIGYNNSKAAIAMGTSPGNFFSGTVTDRHQYHWSIINNVGTVERDDSATISRTVIYDSTRPIPFGLFTIVNESGNDFHFNGKLYACAVYKSGVKVLDLIPCYRKSDNEVGLYDIVNEKFYTNDGTGAFEKGADVE